MFALVGLVVSIVFSFWEKLLLYYGLKLGQCYLLVN